MKDAHTLLYASWGTKKQVPDAYVACSFGQKKTVTAVSPWQKAEFIFSFHLKWEKHVYGEGK